MHLLDILLTYFLWPFVLGVAPILQFMGWAPVSTFTGLCIPVGIVTFYLSLDCTHPLLLDNAPLSVVGFTILTLTLGAVRYRHQQAHDPIGWEIQNKIATRSQVRGQKRRSYACFLVILAIGLLLACNFAFAGGEGSVMDMRDGEVGAQALTKPHVVGPKKVSEPYQTLPRSNKQLTTVQKRSYRRALNRIAKHGYTWYRGQLLSGPIQHDCTSNINSSTQTIANTPPSHRHRRLSIFSWNCGGLSQADWDHFQQWLTMQTLDIVMLQETHWPFSSEWLQSHFFCMHSGAGPRQAGLMTMVSKSLVQQQDLSWSEPIPGRILHTRIHGQHKGCDIINVYQHVHNIHRMTERTDFWHSLHALFTTLPKRNTTFFAGDLNTSLHKRCSAVGLPTFAHEDRRQWGPTHRDADHLYNLLQIYDLVALNTWTHTLGPTYTFGTQCSRIDYIFIKRAMVDHSARDVHYLHNFPLLSLTGAQHVPLMCNVLKAWTPPSSVQTPGWSRSQRKELYLRWTRQETFAIDLQTQVASCIEQLPHHDCDRLHEVHRSLNQFDSSCFKTSKPSPLYKHDVTPFQDFQHHTRCLRRQTIHERIELSHLFEAWFHVSRRQAARRRMNATAKTARKLRVAHLFEQAANAERAHDSFQFFQVIRELAPKQPYLRIQLRSSAGDLLGPAAAADALCDWYRELYSATDANFQVQQFSWPFTVNDMCTGFQSLPLFKALSPDCAPAPIWHAAASSAAEYLQPYLESCSSHGNLPTCWSGGVLTFLNKPGKSGRTPAELRPIALLEPSGKMVMGLLASSLLQSVSDRLFRLPQFAYLPGRGGEEAISRMRQHCFNVREFLYSLRFDIHRAAHSIPGPDVAGGLILSLDLTKAFDSVLRSKLFQALHSLGADPTIIAILSQIYDQTTFSFWHRGQYRTLPTQRGIRQGCKAALILWACFCAWILETAAQTNDWDWIREVVTAYADDFCLHCQITSSADFHVAIAKVGKFLDLLTDAGLTINRAKTIAVLKLQGVGRAKLSKRYLKRTKDGTFICIPSQQGQPYLIKLVSSFSYLGVILSYTNFELLSVRHRIKAGLKVSHQLQRWIFNKVGLSLRQKVKLWFQCIFPCLTYGLRPIGITEKTIQLLDRAFMQQLRRIHHSPVHLNHLTHADFLNGAGIADPLRRLLHQYYKANQRETRRLSQISDDDILHQCPMPDINQLEQVISAALEQRRDPQDLNQAEFLPYSCSQCQMFFSSISMLRRHQLLEHGSRSGLLRVSTATDSHGGVPTCHRCGQMFTQWHNFHYHVQYVCVAPLQENEDVEHRLRVREYLHYVQGMSFVALGQRQDLTTYFSHRCILCGKYHMTMRGLLRHWGDSHNETYRQHGTWHAFLQQHVGPSNPCELCGTHFQREHSCVVIRQYAMYMTFHGQEPPQIARGAASVFPCTSCNKVFMTRHGLDQHLRHFHSAIQAGEQLSATQFEAYCLVSQAVETEACEDLLGHEHIAELLSQVCLLCLKFFHRKNELVRHLKSYHASYWNQCMREAAIIEDRLKGPLDCFCVPKVHNRKHQCLLPIQYVLMRLTAEPGADAELARSTPPDLLLTPEEIVQQLAWLGLLRLLVHNASLKMHLSLHCKVCGSHFTSPTQLMGHMRALHEQAVGEAAAWIRLLTWVLFSAHGCMCNPAVNHGTPAHSCPLIYNLALMLNDGGPGIIVPWPYRAVDLMDVLEPLVTEPVLSKVTTLMMARRFEDVMMSTEVYQLLTQRCLLCDMRIPLSCARTHIRVAHDFDIRNLEIIIKQLACCAAKTHFEHWCSFCGTLLPYDLEDEEFTPCPLEHLMECDYIALIAMLLSFPVWYKKPLTLGEWPSIEEIERGSHAVQLQLMQFNAQPSALHDTLGQSYEQLAACGFYLMSDPKFHDRLHFHCLMCGRKFFTPWRMFEHLQSHNFRQLDTYLCSHRLHLRCSNPCQFCTLQRHLAQLGGHCLPLFHLAVFLCNGGGLRPGQRYLELHSDSGPTESLGHQSGRQSTGQEAEDRQGPQSQGQQSVQAFLRRADRNGGQTGLENGGQLAATAPRTSIHLTSPTRTRFNFASDAGGHSGVAPGPKGHAIATSPGGAPVFHLGGAIDQFDEGGTQGQDVGGMPTAESHRLGRQYALSSLGSLGQNVEADEGCNFEAGRGAPSSAECTSDGARPHHDHPIPWADQTIGVHGQSNSVSLDDLEPVSARGMERSQAHLLSCHLAACEDINSSTRHRADITGQEHPSETGTRIIRILMNPGNICFLNAFMVCQAWATLLAGALDPLWWPMGGLELFRSITAISGLPMNLLIFQPFLWLLNDGWTIADMERQQDVAEFAHWFLLRTQPLFVNCEWAARFLRDGMENDPTVQHERGHKFGIIQLPMETHLETCALQSLVELWHDCQGICRAATQVGRVLIISVSRFLPGSSGKSLTKVVFPNTISFPCYIGDTAEFQHCQFRICGFIFHLGETPHSGHYRAAVHCRNQWLLYEDGRLSDKYVELPDFVLQNTVLFWLMPVDGIADRDSAELLVLRYRNIAEETEEETMADH